MNSFLLCFTCIYAFSLASAERGLKIQSLFSQTNGKYLMKSVLQTIPKTSELVCRLRCSENYECLSVNYKTSGEDSGLCELNNKTLWQNPDVIDKAEFTYLEVVKRIPEEIGCCRASSACLNGGNCKEYDQSYRCSCPDGHSGERCELKPKSCADYATSSNRTHGYRLIYPRENQALKVFCHFRDQSTMTLVLSMSVAAFRNSPNYVLTGNYPKNEESPNWNTYRLSLANMRALRDVSTHWAYTCTYELRGFSTIDYVLSRMNETDLTSYNSTTQEPCRLYEHFNINNNVCKNCRIYTSQGATVAHFAGDKLAGYCDKPYPTLGVSCAGSRFVKYFGDYDCSPLSTFNCANTDSATTQLWFIA